MKPVVVAAVVLVALGVWWLRMPTQPQDAVTPIVVAPNPQVPAQAPEKSSELVSEQLPTTFPNEQVGDNELRLADGSLLCFHQARYRVDVADGNRIALLDGQLEGTIAQRLLSQPIVITTPHGAATVAGAGLAIVSPAQGYQHG